jgi:acyl-CoA thioester hydrolase
MLDASLQPTEPSHRWTHQVTAQEIDALGHANNVEYVRWLQDSAISHSSALGWSPERYLQERAGWVVRTHEITYLKPAREGDEIHIRTWVADLQRVTSLRLYRIECPRDDTLLAIARTNWAFIDLRHGTPRRIPEEIRDAFSPRDLN